MLPIALAKSRGKRTLHLYKDLDASSFFHPYLPFYSRLPEPKANEVVEDIVVETSDLDSLSLPSVRGVDVLKIDAEGAELEILKGSKARLKDEVIAVVAEAMFQKKFCDPSMFADIDILLRSSGFQLADIDMRRWRRRKLPKEFDDIRIGLVNYADVLYLKDSIEYPGMFCRPDERRDKLLKLVAVSEYFSVPDYGIEMVEWGQKLGDFSIDECNQYKRLLASNRIVGFNDRSKFPR